MKNHLDEYIQHLEKTIGEYMERPASERSAESIKGMTECWEHLKEVQKHMGAKQKTEYFTDSDAQNWVSKMENADGTTGAHWTISQTTEVAKNHNLMFDHITEYDWWATMNMVYSDYCSVAEKYGIGTTDFYAEMAKAFLFDKDGGKPKSKLSAYYHSIVL